jgi:hypothetical protein
MWALGAPGMHCVDGMHFGCNQIDQAPVAYSSQPLLADSGNIIELQLLESNKPLQFRADYGLLSARILSRLMSCCTQIVFCASID